MLYSYYICNSGNVILKVFDSDLPWKYFLCNLCIVRIKKYSLLLGFMLCNALVLNVS